MLKLAFRNLFRHKLRTGITLTAVAFGVTALILSGGFVDDMFAQLRESTIHSQLGHIQVYRAGYYVHGRRDPYRYLIQHPRDLSRQLMQLPHVEQVMERLYFSGVLNNGHADLPIEGEGVEVDKERELDSAVTWLAGRAPSDKDAYGIALGEGVARALQLQPGDFATLTLTTPDGALNSLDFKVVGVFRTIGKDYDDHAVRVALPAAQELLQTQAAHSLVVLLDHTRATAEVAAAVEARLPANEYEVKTWRQLADFYDKVVELYKRYFGVMRLIILIMVLLGVLNSVILAVQERIGEFGTMLALGNRGRDLFRLIVAENALLGLFGSLAGVILGVLLAELISAIGIPMPPPPNMSSGYTAFIRVVPSVLLMSVVVGYVATLAAAMLAAKRVSRLAVVDALRHNI
ncbi:MAG: ABC transporter permease [Gammaproteobacteria bacterium]|jgi:putative ABC transport system permease protein